jgi:peptidoglycan/xylan/chitin deacetylase (PgdA/CDA1 family)
MPSSLRPLATLALLVSSAGGAAVAQAPPPAAAPRAERTIAVTVDDLPINGSDPGLAGLKDLNDRLLAALKRHAVPALGFLNESKLYRPGEVDGRIALLAAWREDGLELGNHTYSHPSFDRVGRAAYEEEVIRGETITRLLLERYPGPLRFFRHPFLEAGRDPTEKALFEAFLARRGYTVAPVTVDPWDWYFSYRYAVAKRRGDADLAGRVAAAYLDHCDASFEYSETFARLLFGRDIAHVLLIHENELAADHFDALAERIKRRGYRFVPLDEAMADPAYRHEDRYAGGGANWLVRWAVTAGRADLPPSPRPPAWLDESEAERSPYDPSR